MQCLDHSTGPAWLHSQEPRGASLHSTVLCSGPLRAEHSSLGTRGDCRQAPAWRPILCTLCNSYSAMCTTIGANQHPSLPCQTQHAAGFICITHRHAASCLIVLATHATQLQFLVLLEPWVPWVDDSGCSVAAAKSCPVRSANCQKKGGRGRRPPACMKHAPKYACMYE